MDFFLKLFFLCFFDQACSISFSPYVYLYACLDLAFSIDKLDDSLEPHYAFRLIVLVFFGKGKGEKRETKRVKKNRKSRPWKGKKDTCRFSIGRKKSTHAQLRINRIDTPLG
jgi:hypothetical protein